MLRPDVQPNQIVIHAAGAIGKMHINRLPSLILRAQLGLLLQDLPNHVIQVGVPNKVVHKFSPGEVHQGVFHLRAAGYNVGVVDKPPGVFREFFHII